MEKVIITNCEPVFGGKAHACEFADGRKATAWNDKVEAGLLMQAFGTRQEVSVELKAYDSKGKQGFNIVGFMGAEGQATYEQYAKPTPTQAPIPQETKGLMSVKDIQIISQCMMKCMYYNKTPTSHEEVYDCYQAFVKILEENG